MKAVMLVKAYDPVKKELGRIACMDVPKPQLVNSDDVLIKVKYASICGSDPHLLEDYWDLPIPSPCGHELSGTVEALGPEADKKGLKVGDRVTGNFYRTCGVCNDCLRGRQQFCTHAEGHGAAQAEYIVWRENQVYRIPDDVGLLDAALCEPFNIAVRAVERAGIPLGSHVAVSGAGGIVLMAAQLLKKAGAARVTVLEPVASKRILARKMGADFTIDPARENVGEKSLELTGGAGFDAVIESSGNGPAARVTLDCVRRGGSVVFMSMYRRDYAMSLNMMDYMYTKELTLKGMYLAQESFPRAVDMLSTVRLSPIVEKIYPLDDCVQAYADQMSKQYAKLVFDCEL